MQNGYGRWRHVGLKVVLDAIPNSVPDHTSICIYPVSKGAHLTFMYIKVGSSKTFEADYNF